MKRFLILLSILFCNAVWADTINLHWINYDGTVYENSTCVIDSDLILPTTPPTRYGYTFTGWKMVTYTPIEYLESTGTQYIDTGYKIDLSHDIQIITYIKFSSGGRACICGSYDGDSSKNVVNLEIKNNVFRLYYQNNVTYQDVYSTKTVPYNIKSKVEYIQTPNKVTAKYADDIVINEATQQNFIASSNLLLFRDGRPNNVFSNAYIYTFQIYDNNTLVRDFIPVLDENDVPCMFDRVEGKFYYNQGTGQFIAGPSL